MSGSDRDDEARSAEDRAVSRRMMAGAAGFLFVGVEFAAAVTVGYLGGRWLDRVMATTPVFVAVGVVLGFAAGLVGLWHMTRKLRRDESGS